MKTFIPVIFFLAACGTTHKVVNKEKKSIDSTATVSRDTASVSREDNSSRTLNAKDVDIDITFGEELPQKTPADSALQEALKRVASAGTTTGRNLSGVITGIIASARTTGRSPSSVKIHIGSFSDSSTRSVKKDSSGNRSQATVAVKTNTQTTSKTIHRITIAWWMYVLALLALIYGLYRLNKKYNWLKIFP